MRCYKKVQQVNKWIIWLELRALEIVSYQNVACDRRTMMIADDCWWFTIPLQHDKLLFATALAESQHLSLSISLAMCERDKAHAPNIKLIHRSSWRFNKILFNSVSLCFIRDVVFRASHCKWTCNLLNLVCYPMPLPLSHRINSVNLAQCLCSFCLPQQ